MLFPSSNSGLTLSELLVSVCIFMVLTTVMSSNMASLLNTHQHRDAATKVREAIQYARQQAALNQSRVVVCPVSQTDSCVKDWNRSISVFVDSNRNNRLDLNERQLATLPKPPHNSLVSYPRTAIVFDSQGFSGGYNGSLSYCAILDAKGDKKYGMSIIISRLGRIRLDQDSNSDGLPETANGENVICPKAML